MPAMNPRLVAINGSKKGTTFALIADEVSIGRESASVVSLNHRSVSRKHCLIRRDGEEFKIQDLDSYNGTFVNGIPVKEQTLAHADQLRIGSIALVFLISEGEETTSGNLIRWDDSNPVMEATTQIRPETLLHQTEQALLQPAEHE